MPKQKKQRQSNSKPGPLGGKPQQKQPDATEQQPTAAGKPTSKRRSKHQHLEQQAQQPQLKQADVQQSLKDSTSEQAQQAAVSDPRDDEVRRMFRSWAWKREHRPDKDRFQRPYIHTLTLTGDDGQPRQVTLTITQQKFTSEGFASTVWDSCIVVSKYLEKLGLSALTGKRCLDLSAGCGLAGVVMSKLAGVVTLTDLGPNLPLLQHNCTTNGLPESVAVQEHRWGTDVAPLGPPFDVIVACDVMYVDELVTPLVESLVALTHGDSVILVAHGRNRPAEPSFKAAASAHFSVELVPDCELDDVYQCTDVDVLRLRRLQR